METFKSSELKNKAYRTFFLQRGAGHHTETVHGEGLGNYYGLAMRKTVPLAANTIKGTKSDGKAITIARGTKRNANKDTVIVHSPHKKWRNL